MTVIDGENWVMAGLKEPPVRPIHIASSVDRIVGDDEGNWRPSRFGPAHRGPYATARDFAEHPADLVRMWPGKHAGPPPQPSTVILKGEVPSSPIYDELRATVAHQMAEDTALELYDALANGDLAEAAKRFSELGLRITQAAPVPGGGSR